VTNGSGLVDGLLKVSGFVVPSIVPQLFGMQPSFSLFGLISEFATQGQHKDSGKVYHHTACGNLHNQKTTQTRPRTQNATFSATCRLLLCIDPSATTTKEKKTNPNPKPNSFKDI
jgi:hypothetical protein